MERQQLRKTLEQLDAQLTGTEAADPITRAAIEQMRGDVQRALAQADQAPTEAHESLGEQLRNAIPNFEGSHPTLTMAIAEVVDILNRMGI